MPFQSPNHTQIPNDLFDEMLPHMGYAELKVTLSILRLTLGWHKERAKATLSRLCELTGLSKQAVLDGAEMAEKRGTLVKEYNERGECEWAVYLLDRDGLPTRPGAVKQVDRPSYSKERLNKASNKDNSAADALRMYEQNIGNATPIILEDIAKAVAEYGPEWVGDAIREMAIARAKSWRYAESCLQNWRANGKQSNRQAQPKPITGTIYR